MDFLTEEQDEAVKEIFLKMEKSKNKPMRCIICNTETYDRGLICCGSVPPASILVCGLCYPCKQLPSMEEEVSRNTAKFLISIGREDLIPKANEEYEEDSYEI